jgi:hypothetical protein
VIQRERVIMDDDIGSIKVLVEIEYNPLNWVNFIDVIESITRDVESITQK